MMMIQKYDDYTENHLFTHGVLENQIQGLSRTFIHTFKDFQGPCPFSRTFKAWKIRKKFKDFQGPARALCKTKRLIYITHTTEPNQAISKSDVKVQRIQYNLITIIIITVIIDGQTVSFQVPNFSIQSRNAAVMFK